jgi:membrane dipeptidase
VRWFDAHLDLAYLAETGRDLHVDPEEARGRHRPAAVTLPSLAEGGVGTFLATVFTEAVPDPGAPDAETGAFAYPAGDVDAAFVAGMRQLKLYHAWHDAGVIDLPTRAGGKAHPAADRPRVGILVENADPIPTPGDLGAWVGGGVVAIGLTWGVRGRYASGNTVAPDEPGSGLTDAGRELIRAMDELGVVHDASHLNDRSLEGLFETTDRLVVASHSNCRALMDGVNQRHLTDGAIREIVRRDGVIGLNLCSTFLHPSAGREGRARIEDAARHVEHICAIAGGTRHVGLGSDMDGGFTAARLPVGIDRPRDLERIAGALRDRGWSDADLEAFTHGNWERVFPRLA